MSDLTITVTHREGPTSEVTSYRLRNAGVYGASLAQAQLMPEMQIPGVSIVIVVPKEPEPKGVREWLEDALGRYQVTHIHSSIREALKVMDGTAENAEEEAIDGAYANEFFSIAELIEAVKRDVYK